MVTLQSLQDYCNQVRNERKKEVQTVLNSFLNGFIEKHKPWRAIVGVKKRRPIPIHRYVYFQTQSSLSYNGKLYWPDLSEREIKECIEQLGFVIIGPKLCLAVPPTEKGKSLTFAQKKVREINHEYSIYIDQERKKAKECYQNVLASLSELPDERISFCDGYTLFKDYQCEVAFTSKGDDYFRLLLTQNGFKSIFDEKNHYLGLALLDSPSNN